MMASRTAFEGMSADGLWLTLCSGLSPKDQAEAAWQLAVERTAEWYLVEHGVDLFVDIGKDADGYSLVEDFRRFFTRDVYPLDLELDLYPLDFVDRVYE